jgi:hypothetical protein
MTAIRRRPSAALTIVAATVVAWLSIIAIALAFDDAPARDRAAAPRDSAVTDVNARTGRAGPGYVPE